MCLKLCTAKRVKIKDGRTILIRRPKMSDLKQLRDYINSLVEEDAQIQINKRISLKEEKAWLKGALKNIKGNKAHLLVAELDGRIVSVTNLTKGKGRNSHVAEYGISVLKDYRRLGIATVISKRIIEIGRKDKGIKLISLDVSTLNRGAIRLYEKLGFRKVARLPKRIMYKGKLIDDFVMDLKR